MVTASGFVINVISVKMKVLLQDRGAPQFIDKTSFRRIFKLYQDILLRYVILFFNTIEIIVILLLLFLLFILSSKCK